jgi:hypothetical protein
MSQLITPHPSLDQQAEPEPARRAIDAMLGTRRLDLAEMRVAASGRAAGSADGCPAGSGGTADGRAAGTADGGAAAHATGGGDAAA